MLACSYVVIRIEAYEQTLRLSCEHFTPLGYLGNRLFLNHHVFIITQCTLMSTTQVINNQVPNGGRGAVKGVS